MFMAMNRDLARDATQLHTHTSTRDREDESSMCDCAQALFDVVTSPFPGLKALGVVPSWLSQLPAAGVSALGWGRDALHRGPESWYWRPLSPTS